MIDYLNDVDTKLLRRYDRPGPRYTSYPTAPVWTEDFGPEAYVERLQDAATVPDEPISLYVHIPFCQDRCLFCACNVVVTTHREKAEPYLDALTREMEIVSGHLGERRNVLQLHFGGGTPTFLDVGQLRRLHGEISQRFRILEGAELSIEVDPGVTTPEQIETLRELGFNRISIGVQDFDEAILDYVNRPQTVDQVRELHEQCRSLGFQGINYDLIYGLPMQTPESFRESRRRLLELRPDRLAIYSYAHVPWIKGHQRRIDEEKLPDADTKFRIYLDTIRELLEAGYVQIGMDHFAVPEDELARALNDGRLHRNFMGYTTKAAPDLVSFGVTAISNVRHSFAQNTPVMKGYLEALTADHLPTARGIRLDKDDILRADLIRDLMCHFRTDVERLERDHAIDFAQYFTEEVAELRETIDPEFFELSPTELRVHPKGRLFIRNVCMIFDRYLREKSGDKPVFSRTV